MAMVFKMPVATRHTPNCCSSAALPAGQGNITGDPVFANAEGWRLSDSSLCVNAGTNQAWAANGSDFSGSQCIRYGVIDIGAHTTSMFKWEL